MYGTMVLGERENHFVRPGIRYTFNSGSQPIQSDNNYDLGFHVNTIVGYIHPASHKESHMGYLRLLDGNLS